MIHWHRNKTALLCNFCSDTLQDQYWCWGSGYITANK